MQDALRPYRFLEHGGEAEVELVAPTAIGVFEAGLAALCELLETGDAGASVTFDVDLAESDRALLLAAWLNEFVYLAEIEQFIPERVLSAELTDGRIRATVAGRRSHPRSIVKAVTLNDLRFDRDGGVWRARVVLDV
jgi:SHS2 domain-containing protein